MARLEEGAEEAFKAQAGFGALKEPFPVSKAPIRMYKGVRILRGSGDLVSRVISKVTKLICL